MILTFHFLSIAPSVVVEPEVSERKKSRETWSVSPVPTWTYTKQGLLCQESLTVVLTVLVGVGVTDHRRVLPGLAKDGEAVAGLSPGRHSTVSPATARTGPGGCVAAQHQAVEIKPDLEIFIFQISAIRPRDIG